MSLLLLVSLYEFRQFLQIVLWIAVPGTLIAVALTIFFHYRRKKKQGGLKLAFQDENGWSEPVVRDPASPDLLQINPGGHPEGLPDWLASANPDNTSLLKKYEHEVRRYRENYAILEQDFRELEGKYTDLRNKAYHTDKESDTTLVVQLQEDIKAYKEKISSLQQAVATGKTPAVAVEHSDDERVQALQQLLAQAESERKALKEQLAEQEYLPDVLEEKRIHIDFLQRQLEQRIKNYHLLEQQAGDSAAQLQQLQITMSGFDEQIQRLTGELQVRQEQAAEWQSALERSREEGQQQQELIHSKTGHIEQLEQNVQELKGQQGALQTEIAEQQQSIRSLQNHLAGEQQKAAALETKLELSSQLLLRIYAELAKTLGNHALVNTGQVELATVKGEEENERLQLQASL